MNKIRVLAGAFTQGSYQFQVGRSPFSFTGLQGAALEVESIAEIMPDTTKLLDLAFNRAATIPQLNDHSIVHLATHAAFVPGQPEESFILFGNGDRANLREVGSWNLTAVDLIVLSACQTGVGGILGNGEEVLGLGYQIEQAGALATIASLWVVDDLGTQVLMDAFYEALQSGNQITTAEALRQAQIALIEGKNTTLGQQRGIGVQQRDNEGLSRRETSRLNHPYYWAPFILIGNGL